MSPRKHPPGSITDETSGNRWYIEPDGNGGELRLLSVTTAFSVIAKIGLDIWKTLYTANAAFDELPTILTASRTRPCGRTRHQCEDHPWDGCPNRPCDQCRECVAVWLSTRHKTHTERRSDEGSRVHDVIEWWSLHGTFRPYDPDIAPYVDAFKAFTKEYGITPESFLFCEATCINQADGYAGTTDGALRFDATATDAARDLVVRILRRNGEYAHLKTPDAARRAVVRDKRHVDVIVDWKTRENEGPQFYPDQGLQVCGYRRAPKIRIKGSEHLAEMPHTDGGVVIQLRPDGATVRPAVTDDDTYAAFLAALRLSIWFMEKGNRAVGVNSFPLGVPRPKNGVAVPLNGSDTAPAATAADPFALVGAARHANDEDTIPF